MILEFLNDAGPDEDEATGQTAVQRSVDLSATIHRQAAQPAPTVPAGAAATTQILTWDDYAATKSRIGGFSAQTKIIPTWRLSKKGKATINVRFSRAGSWAYTPERTPALLRL